MKSIHLLAAAALFAGGLFATLPVSADDTVITGKTAVSTDDIGVKHQKQLTLPEGITQKDFDLAGLLDGIAKKLI